MADASDIRWNLLLDELEIKDCVLKMCRAVDRSDWEAVADCYLPDAVEEHGTFEGSPAEMIKHLRDNRQYRGLKQHFVANQLVEINGDQAVCESYFWNYNEFKDDPAVKITGSTDVVFFGGRYVDRFLRVDGRWRIARRVFVVEWSRSVGEPSYWDPPTANFQMGRSDETDALAIALAELRGSS